MILIKVDFFGSSFNILTCMTIAPFWVLFNRSNPKFDPFRSESSQWRLDELQAPLCIARLKILKARLIFFFIPLTRSILMQYCYWIIFDDKLDYKLYSFVRIHLILIEIAALGLFDLYICSTFESCLKPSESFLLESGYGYLLPPHPSEPLVDKFTIEQFNKDYGMELSESKMSSLKRRARSTTPQRTLYIEGFPPPGPLPICAYCNEEIDGATLTVLAPNSVRARKFHPYHFMCCYCQKAPSLRGTDIEHERRPYCNECFYKLYNRFQYRSDEKKN